MHWHCFTRSTQAWLMISTDVEAMSTWFQPTVEALSATYKTTFDSVYVVRHFANECYKLRTEALDAI